MRRTRMKAVSDRRRKRDAPYKAARAAVFERADGLCEIAAAVYCTGRCEQVHHRAGRSGPDPHRLDNLVGCCDDCHAQVHARPAWSYEHGWMTRRNTA